MTIRISFADKTVRVAVEINGAIESKITELPQRPWVGLTDEEKHEIELKAGITEDDDTQGFEPDWADFDNGREVGRVEAFEEIAEKIKATPWENDTKDSFIIWLEAQA